MKDRTINRQYPNRKLIRIGYEELRGHVINYGEFVLRKPPGINLVYHLGMFGWLEECGKLTPRQHSCEMGTIGANKRELNETIQPDLREQVVNLLSNMILCTTG